MAETECCGREGAWTKLVLWRCAGTFSTVTSCHDRRLSAKEERRGRVRVPSWSVEVAQIQIAEDSRALGPSSRLTGPPVRHSRICAANPEAPQLVGSVARIAYSYVRLVFVSGAATRLATAHWRPAHSSGAYQRQRQRPRPRGHWHLPPALPVRLPLATRPCAPACAQHHDEPRSPLHIALQ